MAARMSDGSGSGVSRHRRPAKPRPPAALGLATAEDHRLEPESTFRPLAFADLDLSGQAADGVEFTQCRFTSADLSGVQLDGAAFTDCLVESTNLANLRAERSSMIRIGLSTLRMTGVHWINGVLRDVTVSPGDHQSARLLRSPWASVTVVSWGSASRSARALVRARRRVRMPSVSPRAWRACIALA
ncbi:pentapeptide repeat-containing protein [Micromonospora endolithica]|uniref:Pentapeptide repeat-containing protein n=1 Tax=Micromonospora endolithica TaxID=230091 RepID=A0A3A9YR59_9ACTN|nr:pentapeptide repeat-containing protein [Micromonospora endolithica]TWJ22449.1 pentapeptide repeat protein [Micromonospora endolithica]